MERQHTRHDVISSGNDPLWIVFVMRRVYRIIVIKSCKTRDRLVADELLLREGLSASAPQNKNANFPNDEVCRSRLYALFRTRVAHNELFMTKWVRGCQA